MGMDAGVVAAPRPMSGGDDGWVHVARQPVYDRASRIHGYQLLFRAVVSPGNADGEDEASATTKLIVRTFSDFGLNALVGDRNAFVNVTWPFVVGVLPVPLPADRTILELPVSLGRSPEIIAGVARLAEEGYRLVVEGRGMFLDDPLLQYASYVRVSIAAYDPGILSAVVAELHGRQLMVIGEKVDTQAQAEVADAARVDLMQGHWLSRGDVQTTRTLSPSRVAALRILPRLADPNLEFGEVERIVKADAALTYRLLRAANSAASASTRRITSLRDALIRLGLRQLRSWLMLMVVSDASSVSEEQLTAVITRARCCEVLAAEIGLDPDEAFVGGVLSALGTLLGLEPDKLVSDLRVSDDLSAAIRDGSGRLGQLLTVVVNYEEQETHGAPEVDEDRGRLEALGLSSFQVSRAWLSAVGWALQTCEDITEHDE